MKIVDLLGGEAEYYLNHTCKTIDKQLIHIPGPDMICLLYTSPSPRDS